MIDFLTKKTSGGDLCINLAEQYLGRHEWGLARQAVEEGIAKGHLSEPDKALALLQDICQRMDIHS